MKKIRMVLLLSCTALAATALVAPASASATEWLKNGESLKGSEKIELDGWLERSSVLYSIGCAFEAEATLFEGSKGEITSFKFIPQECAATGQLKECVPNSKSFANAPWDIEAKSPEEVIVNEVGFAWFFNPGCPKGAGWGWAGDLVMYPDSSEAFSSFEIDDASGQTVLQPHGNASVSPAGVYGIG